MNTWKFWFLFAILFFSKVTIADDIFTPFPNSKQTESELRHFIHKKFVGNIKKGKVVPLVKSGSLEKFGYKVDRLHEPSNIFQNYLDQLKKQNAEIVFTCQLDTCGRVKKIKRLLEPLQSIGKDSPHLITAKLTKNNQVYFVSIFSSSWANQTELNIAVLHEKPEPLDLIAINEQAVKNAAQEKEFDSKQNKDKKGSADHPMFGRLQGAFINNYVTNNYAKTDLLAGIKNNQYELTPVEGKLTYIEYRLPRGYSEYEVFRNYQQAFNKLGFKEMFHCQSKDCGKQSKLSSKLKLLSTIGKDENQFYTSYVLERPNGNIYAHNYVIGFNGGLWTELKVVEAKSLNADRITFDADGLSKSIQATGHASLDGLLFKFDSDELLSESVPLLGELARYLDQHPKLNFYVVGHTDDQGKRSYNQALSDRRAQKVTQLLISSHNVSKSQVTPVGIGEYAPVANNQDIEGQKQNRRVELVLRSDAK